MWRVRTIHVYFSSVYLTKVLEKKSILNLYKEMVLKEHMEIFSTNSMHIVTGLVTYTNALLQPVSMMCVL